MRIDQKIFNLKNLYLEVHEQCIIHYFDEAPKEEAELFRTIIGKCESLLNAVQKSVKTFPDFNFDGDENHDENIWNEKNLNEAINQAYGSDKHITKGTVNPYKNWQKDVLADGKKLTIDDIEAIFKKLLEVLKQKQEIDEVKTEVLQIFDNYNLNFSVDL